MGGKSYFCDYCFCFLKNDINVRKVHNAGLAHKITKVNYMRRYEDPRDVLKNELSKTPCQRYLKGRCMFDLYCQNTHYSEQEIEELKEIVRKLDSGDSQSKTDKMQKRKRSVRSRLKKLNLKNLPPSLRSSN